MVGKVLIVDDVATNRIVFKVKLGAACYRPLMAADGESCLRLAREERPDLILLDLLLPDMPGIEVLRALRADPITADVPVVVISACTDASLRLEAFEAGADDFLTKPIDDQQLMARLRNLMRAREGLAELGARSLTMQGLGLAEADCAFVLPGRVALVAERPETALRWQRELVPHLAHEMVVLSREAALAEGVSGNALVADVFVIEADAGGLNGGLELMSELRSRPATRHAAVAVVLPGIAPERMAIAFDMGASDAVVQTVPGRELAVRLKTLMRRKQHGDRLRDSVQDGLRLAVIDPLTGLYNRRYALPRLAAIADKAEATAAPFAVMVVDIDRFKSVNDRFGHAAGDAVLIEVARRLTESLRASDLVARIGGEEFLIALPAVDTAQARATAERLCAAIHDRSFRLPDGQDLTVTISIGLAVCQGGQELAMEPVADLVTRADRALLSAKAEGRNQVTLSRNVAA